MDVSTTLHHLVGLSSNLAHRGLQFVVIIAASKNIAQGNTLGFVLTTMVVLTDNFIRIIENVDIFLYFCR